MAEAVRRASKPLSRSKVSDRVVFLVFLVAYPLLVYPQYLIEMVWQHRGIYFSNGELVYYVPRLVALLFVILLTWRSWTLVGWFPKLLLANAAWIGLVTALHPDPDGLWYTLGGNLNRMDGLVYQILLMGVGMSAYGLVVRAGRGAGEGAQGVQMGLAAAGIGPAALVLLQGAGVDPVGWAVWGRPLPFASATLGHPGFAACILLIGALAALDLANRNVGGRLWAAPLLVEAAALGVTANRTSLIALAVGAALYLALRPSRSLLMLAAVTVALALGGSLSPKHHMTEAGAETHLVSAETLATRERLWHVAGEALTSSPGAFLTGFGSMGFLYVALKLLPPRALVPFWRLQKGWTRDKVESFAYTSNGPQTRDVIAKAVLRTPDGSTKTVQFYPGVDKSHDYFLDRSLAFGVPDALLWLALFLGAGLRALRAAPGRAALLGLAAAVAALLVYGLTWFGVVQTEPLQLIVLAILWAATERRASRAPPVASGT